MKIIEELSESLNLEKGMRVLDLGCGKGLTSIFLAKEYDVTVFATELWISATENYERIKSMGLEDKIIPIHAEAHDLSFADEFLILRYVLMPITISELKKTIWQSILLRL